jgi:hypothetical protein
MASGKHLQEKTPGQKLWQFPVVRLQVKEFAALEMASHSLHLIVLAFAICFAVKRVASQQHPKDSATLRIP